MNSEESRIPGNGANTEVRDASVDDRWNLVQRVVEDETFRRAPRLRELLLFITERALGGRSVELNEHELARAVFRRAEGFNPADDSIVRSSARQLRIKLHEYFEGPGRDEPLSIEIPKGSYVPEFPARATVGETKPAAIPGGGVGAWRTVSIVAMTASLVLGALLVASVRTSKRNGVVAKPANLVSWVFGGRGQEVNVVLCDSALVVVNAYRPHFLSLDDYIAQRDQQPLPLPAGNRLGATPSEFPGKRLITSFRDLSFVQRLSEPTGPGAFHMNLKHSRLMQVRDFRTGSHILLGSPWSNPWISLFEEQLTFKFEEEPGSGSFGLVNTDLRDGEQKFYQCTSEQAHNGISFARIAIMPNLSGQDAVLLVSGLHAESTEGALDLSLSAGFLDQVRRIANARRPEDLNGLELLLEIRAVDGVVKNTRLMSSRHHQRR